MTYNDSVNTSLGSCMSCVTDLALGKPMASGRNALAQAIARRLQTPRGGLIDDFNYGYDLTGYVNDDLAPADIASIQTFVEAECLKDERVLGASVTVQQIAAGTAAAVLIVTIQLTDNQGSFPLVLSITELAVTILAGAT
jgi:phage baseplate assembly protein W